MLQVFYDSKDQIRKIKNELASYLRNSPHCCLTFWEVALISEYDPDVSLTSSEKKILIKENSDILGQGDETRIWL